MTKKAPAYLFWDWKSIIRAGAVLLILALAIFFYMVYPDWKRHQNSKKFSKEAIGTVLNYSNEEYISMSETGNQLKTNYFHVTYKFTVNDKEFNATDKVFNTLKSQKFISQIQNGNYSCYVKYDDKNPNKNQLIMR